MLKAFLVAVAVAVMAPTGQAQVETCLHGQFGARADRARREQAVKVAQQINALQASVGAIPGGRYRRPSELKLPEVPDNFAFSFYTDGGTYMFSLKDSADPCNFAVFSDDQGFVYAGMPTPRTATVVPLTSQ